ncbi:MAG: hypothetical protein HZB16_17925 [Armatimonadetes bacterium]|nr:hypothetical protein [Armatimonadota bacterium]
MSAGVLWARTKAIAVDAASFAAMNAMQWRARGGRLDSEATQAYFDTWRAAGPAAWLAPPPGAALALNEGRCEAPSPLSTDWPANDRVRLDIRLGPNGWRSPAMVLLHALMSVSDRGYRRWSHRLNAAGWTAIFAHLPYHYDRCPRGAASGELAFSANLVRSAEGVRQAVIELRLVAAALRARGCPRWAVWGNSYGALIGALLAVCEPDLYTAWLLEPIVDLEYAMCESPVSLVIRRQLRRSGVTREMMASYVPLLCPRHHRPAMAPERILLMAGRQDRVAPPHLVQALAEHWSGAVYAEADQGHVGYTLMPECWRIATERGWLGTSEP